MKIRRDLAIIIFGIGVAQLIQLGATPFLTRLYSPAEFGVFAVVVAVSGVIATVAALRYDIAIVGSSDAALSPLAKGALLLPIVVAPLLGLIFYGAIVIGIADLKALDGGAMVIVAAIAALQGVTAVGSALCTRSGWFVTSSAIRIAQPLVFVVIALVLQPNLAVAALFGWGGSLLIASVAFRRIRLDSRWSDTRETLRREWRYPVMTTPVALLDVVALALPLLFIAAAYGESDAGNYAQVQRLIGAPLTLTGVAVAQVYFKYAGDITRARTALSPFMLRIIAFLGSLSLAVFVAVFLFGEPVMRLLIGDGWRTDRYFLLVSLVPVICRMTAAPVSSTFVLTGKLALGSSWQIAYFVVTLSVLSVATQWLDFDQMLVAFLCSEIAMYLLYVVLVWWAARRYERNRCAPASGASA